MSSQLITGAEVATYVDINKEHAGELLDRHIRRAQRDFIQPALGETLLTELLAYKFDSGSEENEEKWNELLALVEEALAQRAMQYALPFLSVNMSAAGLQIVQTDNHRPAYQWQQGDIAESLHFGALNSLEAIYVFVETNKAVFTAWTGSALAKTLRGQLIRTAVDFSAHYNIADNRVTFLDLRPALLRAQDLDMMPKLGAAFIERLLTTGGTEEEQEWYTKALLRLKPVVAHFTIARAEELVFRFVDGAMISTRLERNSAANQKVIDDRLHAQLVTGQRERARATAEAYLEQVRAWLDVNADHFQEYKTGPGYRDPAGTRPDVSKKIHGHGGSVMV